MIVIKIVITFITQHYSTKYVYTFFSFSYSLSTSPTWIFFLWSFSMKNEFILQNKLTPHRAVCSTIFTVWICLKIIYSRPDTFRHLNCYPHTHFPLITHWNKTKLHRTIQPLTAIASPQNVSCNAIWTSSSWRHPSHLIRQCNIHRYIYRYIKLINFLCNYRKLFQSESQDDRATSSGTAGTPNHFRACNYICSKLFWNKQISWSTYTSIRICRARGTSFAQYRARYLIIIHKTLLLTICEAYLLIIFKALLLTLIKESLYIYNSSLNRSLRIHRWHVYSSPVMIEDYEGDVILAVYPHNLQWTRSYTQFIIWPDFVSII